MQMQTTRNVLALLSVTHYRNEDSLILTAYLWTVGISPRALPLFLSLSWFSSTCSLPSTHPPSKFSLGSPYKACRYLLAHFMSRHWLSIRFPSLLFHWRFKMRCCIILFVCIKRNHIYFKIYNYIFTIIWNFIILNTIKHHLFFHFKEFFLN